MVRKSLVLLLLFFQAESLTVLFIRLCVSWKIYKKYSNIMCRLELQGTSNSSYIMCADIYFMSFKHAHSNM